MNKIYIAIDIGASSGRFVMGQVINGKLDLKEVHRFKNSMMFHGGTYQWNIDNLFTEILKGLVKCGKEKQDIESIGIDTWAVDYVLLDERGKRIAPVFAYRDHRTDKTMEKVFKVISKEKIYKNTGIQFLQFNTLYQLYEHMAEFPEDFQNAKTLLMIPDYLNYRLCGKMGIEFTNATSSQLLNVTTKEWDDELLSVAKVDKGLMPNIVEAGTFLGTLTKDIGSITNLDNVKIVAPATHDTGSAVVAIPSNYKNFAYISSGTWSLMGIESEKPNCSSKALKYNFTNEGGVFGTYRILKNIMGLWLIQEVKRVFKDVYSFAELTDLAAASEAYKSIINPNHPRFLNPKNMIEEIQAFCKETNQYIPETVGEIGRCIFESLACQYRLVLDQLRDISDIDIQRIHIIGGGCQNKLLNQLCADFTECYVYAGPIEATAIGNLSMQMIASGELDSVKDTRKMVKDSFKIEMYEPTEDDKINQIYNKFKRLQEND